MADARSYEQELLRARQVAEEESARARRLAATLLPPTLPAVPGMEIAAHYHPASTDQVGGDFYDLFPITGDTWGFFLGDVSGKGAEAAVVTSLARYTLRSAVVYDPDPVAVLANLNSVLYQEQSGANPHFCTVVLGQLVPEGDGCTVVLAGGGHPPALLLRADGTVEFLETRGGRLVGVYPNAHFATVTVSLRPGDTLLLSTDGLIEARTHGRTRYSEEQLHEFAVALGPTTAPAVIAAVRELLTSFGTGVDDDVALLALSIP